MIDENNRSVTSTNIRDMSTEELVDKFAHMARLHPARTTPQTSRYYYALRGEILRRMKKGEANG